MKFFYLTKRFQFKEKKYEHGGHFMMILKTTKKLFKQITTEEKNHHKMISWKNLRNGK